MGLSISSRAVNYLYWPTRDAIKDLQKLGIPTADDGELLELLKHVLPILEKDRKEK